MAITKSKVSKKKQTHRGFTLIIVESPAKAHTIEKYLGTGYVVRASMGHLIDLPKSRMAVDIEHNFEPEYITVRGRGKVLHELQQEAKKATTVLLASDNDREGEAIAWHLNRAIVGKTNANIARIVFNEITPQAIKEAVKHPGIIQETKVNAQKARRVLDRLVGYNLSPLLWEKVKNGLSAGRVQSVALKLICEREEAVLNFIPEEYWTLQAKFSCNKVAFTGQLILYKGEKPQLKNEESVKEIVQALQTEKGLVTDIKTGTKSIKPKPPFTTSTLQQVAATRLGFVARKTMQIAQQLYEGVDMKSSRVGLITYMRTDSVRLSEMALGEVRKWIGENYADCLPPEAIYYSVGKSSQDAHEAIRPTYVNYTPEYVTPYLTKDQLRLYTIIWQRFVACQMLPAIMETVGINVTVKDTAVFHTTCSTMKKKSFYAIANLLYSKEEIYSDKLPMLEVGKSVKVNGFEPEQHFTQGPSRYSDASIVKTLEEKGIGRPSTYAPIISVLLDRGYVTRSNKQLLPSELGKMINSILVNSFPAVINEEFTALVENNLDNVEQGHLVWQNMMNDFYWSFKKQLDTVMQNTKSIKGTFDEQTGEVCDKCGKPMLKKLGRYGYFVACSGFPECRNAKPISLAKCPKPGCNGDIVARRAKKRGKLFYACTNYPTCDFLTNYKPISATCPSCGWFLVEKYDKKNGAYKSCINPACTYLHSVTTDE